MPNFFTDNDDLVFQFEKNTDWDTIVPGYERGFTEEGGFASTAEALEVYRELLTQVGEFAAEEIAPTARALDKQGIGYKDGEVVLPEALLGHVQKLASMGILVPQLSRRWGGANLPYTVTAMMLEVLSRADLSTMIQYAFYGEPAAMIERFGSEAQCERFIGPLASGEWSGAIAITEPQAGSDIGAVSTKATKNGDGWIVTGQKQFITNGCGDVCLTLARTDPTSNGLDGLSIVIVPRKNDDGSANYDVQKSESKLCIRASATCGLSFDGSDGELLGAEPGQGFQQMLTFMNEARIAVAIQAIGLAEAARDAARRYADERVQMGRPIARHELVAEMLERMDADIRGMRALTYHATRLHDRADALERGLPKLAGAEKEAAERKIKALRREVRELVPLSKYGAPERACRITRDALQIHGGYGITTDYDVERYYRDATILAIYEGTSQIQALMALKDQLKWEGSRVGGVIADRISSWFGALLGGDPDERALHELENARHASTLAVLGAVRRAAARSSASGSLAEKLAKDLDITAGPRRVAEHYVRLIYLEKEAALLKREAERFPERRTAFSKYVRRARAEAREARTRLADGLE